MHYLSVTLVTMKNRWIWAITSVVLIVFCLIYIYFVDPDILFKFQNISLSPVLIFFLLVFITLLSFFYALFTNIRRTALGTICLEIIILLKFFNFKNIFHYIVLIIIFILIEIYFFRKTPKAHNQTHRRTLHRK